MAPHASRRPSGLRPQEARKGRRAPRCGQRAPGEVSARPRLLGWLCGTTPLQRSPLCRVPLVRSRRAVWWPPARPPPKSSAPVGHAEHELLLALAPLIVRLWARKGGRRCDRTGAHRTTCGKRTWHSCACIRLSITLLQQRSQDGSGCTKRAAHTLAPARPEARSGRAHVPEAGAAPPGLPSPRPRSRAPALAACPPPWRAAADLAAG